MEKIFDVKGMTCSACALHVEKAAKSVPGLQNPRVNLSDNTLRASGEFSAQALQRAIKKAGYAAFPQGTSRDAPDEYAKARRRLILMIAFALPLLYVSMGSMAGLPLPESLQMHGQYGGLAQLILTIPILILGRGFFTRGFSMLFRGAPNMDSLIAVGAAAAFLYSCYALAAGAHMELYFESAGVILTLITVGKTLEARAKGKTRSAVEKLLALAPDTALVMREGAETEIPLSDVREGDIVIVKPGTRVPVDGEIISGASGVDESTLTGESMPVDKKPGDKVMAATMNLTGAFTFRAQRVGEDTTLSQIIRLTGDAASSKAPIARVADRVSGVFVPAVLLIALVTFIIWIASGAEISFALKCAISVLVISCPCALGLATPMAIVVGTGMGAERGILFRSAEALETARFVTVAALDKTGTLTEGKPRVTDILPLSGTEDALLSLAASLEKSSEHPLARAILERAGDMLIPEASDFSATPGLGVKASIGGKIALGGSPRYLKEEGIDTGARLDALCERFSDEGKTPLCFALDGKALGVIAVADTLRESSARAVRELKEMNVRPVMLTGDNERTARAIARSAGIDDVAAGLLPGDKEKTVRALMDKGERVAMVGDGVNDAPALTRADVSFAVSQGADIAVDAADITLMRPSLLAVPEALRLSRLTLRNVKQNLFWAFIYNAVGIPVAAGALFPAFSLTLSPMLAAAAMSLSSVSVVSNALRLRLQKINKEESITMPDQTTTLKISGMSCDHCRKRVEDALQKVRGVQSVKVDLASATAAVVGSAKEEKLIAAVREAGYEVVK